MNPVIRTKQEFIKRWHDGEFGNKLRTWDNVHELLNDSYTGPYTIRCKTIGGNKYFYYVPKDEVYNKCIELSLQGIPFHYQTFNESAPDDKLTIQGEVLRTSQGLQLIYSNAKLPMRKALTEDPKFAKQISAKTILEYYLNANSYEDINILQELYPNSVIEFSTYSFNLGNIPHRNTIIWEVRNY